MFYFLIVTKIANRKYFFDVCCFTSNHESFFCFNNEEILIEKIPIINKIHEADPSKKMLRESIIYACISGNITDNL